MKFLKPIKLSAPEEVIIDTDLSKDEALGKIRNYYVGKRLPFFKVMIKPNELRFTGQIEDDGFELYLATYKTGQVFCPPKIKGKLNGDANVSVHLVFDFPKISRMFLTVFSGAAILWLIGIVLAIGFGLWGNVAEPSTASIVDTEESIGEVGLILALIFPLFIIPLGCIFLPAYLAEKTKKRSIFLMRDIFK